MADQTSLAISEVLDYCWCPKYYDLKHQNPNELNLKELYDKALHRVFYSYLTALQQDTLKESLGFLKYKWGKEWVKQKTNSQIICTPSALKRDTYEMKRKAGIDAIITFDDIMNVPQFPIIINKPYSVSIGSIELTGIWEYVRELERPDGSRVVQLMKFRTENNRFQMSSQMSHDLELTAAALAFQETFNVNEFELVYVDIYKKKLVASTRTAKDYDLLKNTVKSVSACLKAGVRCISPDKKCYHCEYRNKCEASLR